MNGAITFTLKHAQLTNQVLYCRRLTLNLWSWKYIQKY